MPSTLFQKVWDLHTVRKLPNGQTQLFVGLHLIHEVTTPQAFDMLRARGMEGAVSRTHDRDGRPHRADQRSARGRSRDVMAEDMLAALERNCARRRPLFDLEQRRRRASST